MKVCPVCGTTYSGTETFCPKDGSKLEAQAPGGELVGQTLSDIVKLERLDYGDRMGERYEGRLIDTKRGVYVTVFNRQFTPSKEARRLVETARAKVGNPLPAELSALLRVNFESDIPFVCETAPAGPSIRALLQERQRMDWQTAVRIACNVARIIDWLAGHGVAHHGLHPGSIFVTDMANGKVQLAEWYSEDAQWVENPMQVLSQDEPPFVGYVAYMAPELAENSSASDLRSAVYALGVLLYEMIIGKPPFVDARGAEVLRQHQHEQPVKVSIARGGGKVHKDLDHIVEMMLAKDPDARFQAPAAIVAALSNLIDSSPDEVAPAIERAEKQIDDDIFQTIEMSSVDRSAVPGLKEMEEKRDSTAQHKAAKATPKKGEQAGVAPGVHVDPALMDEDNKQKTLVVGNIGAALEAEGKRREEEADDKMKTLMMGSSPFAEPSEAEAGLGEQSSRAEILKPAKISGKSETKPNGESDANASATSEIDTAPDRKPVTDEALSARDADATVLDTDLASAVEARHAASEADESSDSGRHSALESGERRSLTLELQRDEWFAKSTEEAWEDSLAEHHHERSEKTNKALVMGLMAFLLVGFVGLFLYFEFSGPSEEEPKMEETTEETQPEPKADIDALARKFDTALDSGRIVAPSGNSALTFLNELEREAPEDERYETRRKKFVEVASAEAKKKDEEGDLMQARALAGYASRTLKMRN